MLYHTAKLRRAQRRFDEEVELLRRAARTSPEDKYVLLSREELVNRVVAPPTPGAGGSAPELPRGAVPRR
jgi:hypothetical protein